MPIKVKEQTSQPLVIDLGPPINMIEIIWRRGSYKNISLKIDRNGKVSLNSSNKTTVSEALDFLNRKASWIKKHLQNISKRELLDGKAGQEVRLLGSILPLKVVQSSFNRLDFKVDEVVFYCQNISDDEYRNKIFAKLYKCKAEQILIPKTIEIFQMMFANSRPQPLLRISKMKTMWGNCRPKKNIITLNEYLIKGDLEVIEYLIIHELTHLIHAKHDRAFYEHIEMFMPSYRKVKAKLKFINPTPIIV